MNKFLLPVLFLVLPLTLSACASFSSPDDPQKDGQYVSLVNRLTWTNPLSGKRDGLRSSWPLKKLQGEKEYFPLAQIKQCDAAGACSWGVMSAQRKVTFFSYVPGGLQLDVSLLTDIARRQEVHQPGYDAVMAIPSDVSALSAHSELARSFNLQYGEVQRIDLDYGVRFDVCALRYDAGGHALDVCDIDHI